MAISLATPTHISLNRFAQFFNLNPMFFNYLDPSCIGPVSELCLEFWNQYAWTTSNGLSIELLAKLLNEAETEVREFYGYTLGEWIVGERHQYPFTVNRGAYTTPYINDVVFRSKFDIDTFGQRATNHLANRPIVYSGTYSEIATVTYTLPTGVLKDDLHFYYPGFSGNELYEIRDFSITVAAGVATIVFNRWDLVTIEAIKQTQYIRQKANNFCGDIYLMTVDIGSVTIDTCLPSVSLFYNADPCNSNCGYSHIPACATKVSNRVFSITPQTYVDGCVSDGDSPTCITGGAQYIEINYFSKSPYLPLIQSAIFYITAARFPLQGCDCSCVKNTFGDWQSDTRYKPKNDGQFVTNYADNRSPFGTRLGELKAFRILENIY